MMVAPVAATQSKFGMAIARRTRWLLLGLAACAISIATAKDQPASQPAVAGDQEARAFLDRAFQRYARMRSYQDKLAAEMRLVRKQGVTEAPQVMPNFAAELAWAGENRVWCKTEELTIVCDGKTGTVYHKGLKQYITKPAPTVEKLVAMIEDAPLHDIRSHLLFNFFVSSSSRLAERIPGIRSLTRLRAEPRDGVEGHLLTGTADIAMLPSETPAEFSAWFDKEGLLREVRLDATTPYRRALKESARHFGADADDEDRKKQLDFERAELVLSFSDIRVDAEINADRFKFVAADRDRRVDTFEYFDSQHAQSDLVGKPAPEFSGKALDGEVIDLQALRGRVVLLDFWATWCGPCVAAIPSVQKLHEQFRDQPVTIIGMNRDPAGSEERVRKFLEKKSITFRHFMADGELAAKFGVRSIPSSVLIDAKGIVRDVHVGFAPGLEERLADSIARLVKGDAIAATDAPDASTSGPARANPAPIGELQEVAPERLVLGDAGGPSVGTHNMVQFDTDGDGTDELIAQSFTRGAALVILNARGEELRRMRFRGASSLSMLTAFLPIRSDGVSRWLTVFTKYSHFGDQSSTIEIALYDDSGERLWSYSPPVEAKLSCSAVLAAGDLDADGTTEYVAGVTVYRMDPSGLNSFTSADPRATLLVLDADGKLISSRRMGKGIERVEVVRSSKPGESGELLCFSESRLRRVRLELGEPGATATMPATTTAVVPVRD